MFPIRGLVSKKDHEAPWVVYSKLSQETLDESADTDKREKYEIIGKQCTLYCV